MGKSLVSCFFSETQCILWQAFIQTLRLTDFLTILEIFLQKFLEIFELTILMVVTWYMASCYVVRLSLV